MIKFPGLVSLDLQLTSAWLSFLDSFLLILSIIRMALSSTVSTCLLEVSDPLSWIIGSGNSASWLSSFFLSSEAMNQITQIYTFHTDNWEKHDSFEVRNQETKLSPSSSPFIILVFQSSKNKPSLGYLVKSTDKFHWKRRRNLCVFLASLLSKLQLFKKLTRFWALSFFLRFFLFVFILTARRTGALTGSWRLLILWCCYLSK